MNIEMNNQMFEKIEFEDLSIVNKPIFNRIRQDSTIINYIHVASNYFDYLLSSNQIIYKLIKQGGTYVGGLHIELLNDYATFSIEIMKEYQRQGIATYIINLLKRNVFEFNVNMYKVFIEINNHPSISLFTKCGFIDSGTDNGILEFTFIIDSKSI